jgi:AcrR family transcriptional regulator
MDATPVTRMPGRPRSATVDQRILDVTIQQLVERGYDAMSIEGIATAAGVGKTTIYRRYPGKRELVVGALSSIAASLQPPPDTGDARADLRAFVRQTFGVFRQDGLGFAMIGTLLVREREDPELMERFRAEVIRPRIEAATAILRRGVERGEVRWDVRIDVVVQMVAGALFARHVAGQPEDDAWVEAVFEILWEGAAAR